MQKDGRHFWSFTEDLSMGGLFFHSFHPPDAGERLDILLGGRADNADLLLPGRVVHRRGRTKSLLPGDPAPRPPGAGIAFENLSQHAKKSLASLLLSQSPNSCQGFEPSAVGIDLFGQDPGPDPGNLLDQGCQALENPRAILRLFQLLCSKIHEVRVRRPGSGIFYTTYFLHVEPSARLGLVHAEPVYLRDSDLVRAGKVQLVFYFSLEGDLYTFSLFVAPERLAEPWTFPLPERIYQKKDSRQPRYTLEMRYPLTVEFPDPEDPHRHRVKNVVDLSYRGISFKNYPGEEIYQEGTYLPDVKICAFDLYCRNTDAVVRHSSIISRSQGEIYQRIGLEFPEPGFGTLEEIPRIKEGEMERITGHSEILSHMRQVCLGKVKVLAEAGQGILFTNGTLCTRKQNGDTEIAVHVPLPSGLAGRLFTEGTITCHYLFFGMYHFFKVPCRRENGGFRLEAPLTIYKARRRRALRIQPGKVAFRFSFLHPILGRKFTFPVRDVSTRGLSFEGDYLQHILWKGFSLRGCEILMGDETLPAGPVEIRSVYTVPGPEGAVERCCGVEFLDLPVRTERRISLQILHENNPQIRTLTSEKIDNLWKLFYQSGFIYPSKEAYIRKIKADINETWKKLLSDDTSFYKNIVFREGVEEMGTASAVQVYENTWMFQHLAATGHPVKLIPKYVMLGLAQFLMENQEIQYLITYFQPDNSFPRRIYSGFLDAYPLEEHLRFSRYSFLTLELEAPQNGADRAAPRLAGPADEISVEHASEEDREVMENYFRKNLHPLLIRSRSLYRDAFHLPETSSLFFARGLLRERHCMVAREEGQGFAAFALLENASPGINLSGLLNTFSVWSLPGARDAAAARRRLIRAAVDQYRSWGARTAICLTEEADLSDYLAEGFRKNKEYVCFSLSRRTIKNYYDYVQERFGRFEQRKLKRRPAPSA